MKRWPLVPTILVALACAAMVALGFWQLSRRQEKQAFIAQVSRNPALPPVAFPRFPDDDLLFRRASGFCLQPMKIERAGAGAAGYRLIAHCRTGGAEGPGMQVQLGTTREPRLTPAWRGGEVSGWISHAPDSRPLIASLWSRVPQQMLLVSDTPAPGLQPNTRPTADLVPNNHLAYAGQWFFFALVAATIYILASRRRFERKRGDAGAGG